MMWLSSWIGRDKCNISEDMDNIATSHGLSTNSTGVIFHWYFSVKHVILHARADGLPQNSLLDRPHHTESLEGLSKHMMVLGMWLL